jgi:hypothetical protein
MLKSLARAGLGLALVVTVAACPHNKDFEDANPSVSGSHFKTIATVAGSSTGSDMRLMVKLRQQLKDGGWSAEARPGRWDSAAEMVSHICSPGADNPVDGVLLVTYERLTLYDCQTLKAAYDIQGSPMAGGMGLDEMTKHLIRYLQGKAGKER